MDITQILINWVFLLAFLAYVTVVPLAMADALSDLPAPKKRRLMWVAGIVLSQLPASVAMEMPKSMAQSVLVGVSATLFIFLTVLLPRISKARPSKAT